MVAAGADWLVAGTAVFTGGGARYAANIAALREAGEAALPQIALSRDAS